MILEGSPQILGMYPEDLQKKALEQLNALGVVVRCGARVTDIQPGYVMVGDGERMESVCTLWAAGVAGLLRWGRCSAWSSTRRGACW